jgi:hypothetical protein
MLFDLSRDARESTNLVDRSATVAAHLQSGLREFVRSSRKLSGKPVTTVPDAQMIEHLRALGYVQ